MTGGSSMAVTLTTLNSNDIIVLAIHSEALNASGSHAAVASVADTANLTWAKRSSVALDNAGAGNAYNDAEMWWAFSSGVLTGDVITITLSKSVDAASVAAWGVNGANTAAPWDGNASLPATAK